MASVPPGPSGDLLFGSSRRYARDPFRFMSAIERAYGDVARFWLGPLETFMIANPKAIERVLVSEADRFRKPDFQDAALGDLLGEGLLLSEGATWEHQRRLANPAFGPRRLARLAHRITGHAERLVAGWSDGEVVDAERAMTRVTLDVILDLMLGVELPASNVRSIQTSLEPLGRRFEPDPIRFAAPEWLPLPGDREYERALGELEGVLSSIVERRLGTVDGDDPPMDVLSILLRARERGDQTDGQLRDQLMTMLLAGHDTTALALTYTWFLLSEHPDAERRVHEELRAVVGDDRPDVEHVRGFDYVERVVQEAMRLYPPVYTIFRSPTERVELVDYEIPAGAAVMLPVWAVHRSNRYWDEPDAFDPDRFLPDRRAARPRFAYFPFGGGHRHCVGKHLAMLEAQLIIATVARSYRLEFLGDPPLDLLPSLTAHPRDDMRMRLHAR